MLRTTRCKWTTGRVGQTIDPICIVFYVFSLATRRCRKKAEKERRNRKDKLSLVYIYMYILASDRCRSMLNMSDMFRYVHFLFSFSQFLTEHWPVSLSFAKRYFCPILTYYIHACLFDLFNGRNMNIIFRSNIDRFFFLSVFI